MLHPNPDSTDCFDKHWTSAENTTAIDPGVTRENINFLDQHETVDVEWGDGATRGRCALRSSLVKATHQWHSSSCQPYFRLMALPPRKETLKFIHGLCDLHSYLHLHDAQQTAVPHGTTGSGRDPTHSSALTRASSTIWPPTTQVPRAECDIEGTRAPPFDIQKLE